MDPNGHRMIPVMTLEDKSTKMQLRDQFGCSPGLQGHADHLVNRNTM